VDEQIRPAVAVEITLPVEHQSVAGVLEYRAKLAQAATDLGWPAPHSTDTVLRLAGNVPPIIALKREKLPIAVALYWEVDSDHAAIYRVLAAIRREFDCDYTAVDGALVAADDPEILAATPDLDGVPS
jgi:hypothetical protein